ncbi:MAG: hypothetical protein WC911_01715 [Thermoleophilia bacterium]
MIVPEKIATEIIALLRQLSDILGSRNCNDREWPEDWTDDEKRAFIRIHHLLNSGTKKEGDSEWEYLQEDLRDLRCPSDFVFPSVFAAVLEKKK